MIKKDRPELFKKKIFFLFLISILSQFIIINLSFSKINIILSVDNDIITNYDISKEEGYLEILNPNLKNLNDSQMFEIAKQSLIKEMIKKKEISKFVNLDEDNDFADNYLKQILIRLGYKDEIQFKNELLEYKSYTLDEIKQKSKIEIYWNELIYSKYINKINIDKKKLQKTVEKLSNEKKELLLSEIVFRKKTGEDLENIFKKIKTSINEIGFNNTANLYSISESSKFGGKIGWLQEKTLSKKIYESIKTLEINEVSNVIKIDNNFIILKLEDIRFTKNEVDKDKELQRLISIETNKKLENYSKIYFNRIKTNFIINEK